MMSRKAKYGIHALLILAAEHGSGPILISEIASRGEIPKKFLELILLQLKKQGILQSRKGRGGGYFLGRDPSDISVGQVLRILDGPLAPTPCVSQTAYMKCDECVEEKFCGIRLVMKEVRDAIAEILDGESLSDVLARVRAERSRLRVEG